MIVKKEIQTLEKNGNQQKFGVTSELEGWVSKGWDYVTALPDEKVGSPKLLPTEPIWTLPHKSKLRVRYLLR